MVSRLIVLNVESSDFVFADVIILRSNNISLFFFLPSSTHHLLLFRPAATLPPRVPADGPQGAAAEPGREESGQEGL